MDQRYSAPNGLFSRDLKYLLDTGGATRARGRWRRRPVAVAVAALAVAVCSVWLFDRREAADSEAPPQAATPAIDQAPGKERVVAIFRPNPHPEAVEAGTSPASTHDGIGMTPSPPGDNTEATVAGPDHAPAPSEPDVATVSEPDVPAAAPADPVVEAHVAAISERDPLAGVVEPDVSAAAPADPVVEAHVAAISERDPLAGVVEPDVPAVAPPASVVVPDAAAGSETASDGAQQQRSTIEWVTLEVQSGDTLGGIFQRRGLRPADAVRIASLEGAGVLSRLQPGRELQLGLDAEGAFVALRYEVGPVEYLAVQREGKSYEVSEARRDVDIRHARAAGFVKSSLYQAGADAGVPEKITMALEDIFGWDIDFARKLRQGDRFTVIYEEHLWEGEKLADGALLAAEFVNDGEAFRAIRFTDNQGRARYYTPDGRSLRRAFLRAPVKQSRISSLFSKRRLHPILKKWRAHKGVDYAAPAGTPVHATADGRIVSASSRGGYGKTVIIQHGHAYTTLYAHLSRFAAPTQRGAPVRQGDVIGYVGSTGLASGPHLHYEFRINGIHRNPLTVEQPPAEPIPETDREQFQQIVAVLTAQLDSLGDQSIALRD